MKISTEIESASVIVGEEKAIEYIARAGFDAYDFSMFGMFEYNRATKDFFTTYHPLSGNEYLKFARKLKQVALDNGIKCNQSHAPFPTCGENTFSYMKRAIECTAEAGGEICVIHPDVGASVAKNAEMYSKLLEFSKGYGVKIATENMWDWNTERDEASISLCSTPECFKEMLDAVRDDFFVACVDVGHAEMRGLNTTAPDMIRYLGNSVQALHLHDNDMWQDSHQIPFSMKIDFAAIARALADIGYNGYITLEASKYLKSIDTTPNNILDGLGVMAAAAKKISDFFN